MKLSIRHVSKSYGKTRALTDFCADLEPGIYALLGPNGSGKSTLMNIITDNLAADEGEILFSDGEGEPENVLQMGARFRERVGFMPQYTGMYPHFTVGRFMWYAAALKDVGADKKGKDRNEYVQEQIDGILAAVGLDDAVHRRICTLSGGMKQRLALAQAVLGGPSVLILDEPTAGLDPKQRIAIRNFIAGIALDRIVIIATHVVSDVEYIAREVIMLKKGRVVDRAPPHELTRRIEGRVWQVTAAPEEISGLQEQVRGRVVNIQGQSGDDGVLLRILSETKPTDTAVPVPPTLEDCCLSVFGTV